MLAVHRYMHRHIIEVLGNSAELQMGYREGIMLSVPIIPLKVKHSC